MNGRYNEILNDFLYEGDEDYIGLWQVIGAVAKASGFDQFKITISDSEKLLEAVLEFVQIMLSGGFEVINLAANGGYVAWPDQVPDNVGNEIRSEWIRLGGPLSDVGYNVWFNKINKQPIKRRKKPPQPITD